MTDRMAVPQLCFARLPLPGSKGFATFNAVLNHICIQQLLPFIVPLFQARRLLTPLCPSAEFCDGDASTPVLVKLFVAADPFHCTQNRCGSLIVLTTFFRLLRN